MSREKDKVVGLSPAEEMVFKVTKEIVVKFIEVGRLSPAAFPDTFKMVIDTVRRALEEGRGRR